ncbi:hypothetical protein HY642_01790 [Candidatus Woesearchaeota archaeon]|nr:hypothetical protein [Candidatus Woesearchaeota archaeon]
MVKAAFEFVAKYPIQMLIAGGILLLIFGQTTKTTGVGTSSQALVEIGSQTASWGWGLLVIGIIVFLIYIFKDRF